MSLKEFAFDEFASCQITVGTTPTNLPARRVRNGLRLKAGHSNTGTIYIGNSAGVSSSTGFALAADEFVDVEVDDRSKVFAVTSGANQVLTCLGA